MSNDTFLSVFLSQMAGHGLLCVVYVVGIILAVARWRRHSKASLLALIGLSVLLLDSVASAVFISYFVTTLQFTSGVGSQVFRAINIAFGVIAAAGTGLLVAGVFAGRSVQPQEGFTVLPPHGPRPPVLPRHS